jgi:predicted MFS family arabinose efflux permease
MSPTRRSCPSSSSGIGSPRAIPGSRSRAPAAQVVGPGLGGFLVGVISAPLAILADALSYLGSAAFLFRIRRTVASARPAGPDDPAGGRRPSIRAEIAEGLRFYAKSSLLLAESAAIVMLNLGGQIGGSISLVFVVRELAVKPEVIGLAFSIASIGLIIGAATADAFGRRIGVGRVLIIACAISAGSAFVITLATPATAFALLVVSGALQGFAVMVININGVSLRQALTPDELQGRVNATGRWINWSIIPVGSLIGGALATAIGLRATIAVGAGVGLLALPWLLLSPIRSLREMPRVPIGARQGRTEPLVPPPTPGPPSAGQT